MLSQHSIIRYHIDFYFPKYKAIELDKKRSKKVTLTEWTKRNKKTRSNKKKISVVNLLALILIKKTLILMFKLLKYAIKLLNQPKN